MSDDSSRPDPEVLTALETVAAHGEDVRAEAVETALQRLEAEESLSADERAAVEALADRLVGRLLATPTATLLGADADDAETALTLFGRSDRAVAADGGAEERAAACE